MTSKTTYKGTGGPPPSEIRAQNAVYGRKPFGYHLYEALPNGKNKKVSTFKLSPGEKNVPFVILDAARVADENLTYKIHENIKFGGSFSNMVLCNNHLPEGCLLDKVLEKPHTCFTKCKQPCKLIGTKVPMPGTWKWVVSGLKMKPFTFEKGAMAGKTIAVQRCLLLVGNKQFDTFNAFRETFDAQGGLRGMTFIVSRSNDQRSPKIGETWIPTVRVSDEDLVTKCATSADFYGLPVEDFIRPFDYESVFRHLTTSEMASAAKWIGAEYKNELPGLGDKPELGTSESSDSDLSVDSGNDDDDIPF